MNSIKETKARDNHRGKLLLYLIVVIALGTLILGYIKGMIPVLTTLIIAGVLVVVYILVRFGVKGDKLKSEKE